MHEIADVPSLSTSAAAESSPLLETAAELRSVARGYQDDIERERRLPPPLVAELRAAGFYSMVIPRALGGRQVDLMTFLRVAEVMAEGDGSVGWNLANNSVGQLVALSLPDDGGLRLADYTVTPETRIAIDSSHYGKTTPRRRSCPTEGHGR